MDYQALPPAQAPVPAPSHSFGERVIGALRLERPIFDELRRDPSAMVQAAIVVAIAAFASGFGNSYTSRNQTFTVDSRTYEVGRSLGAALFSGVFSIVVGLIGWVLISLVYRFVATRMLGSSETNIQWQEVARPMGFASAPTAVGLLAPIPFLGGLLVLAGAIWGFATSTVALSETFRVSKWRAFGVLVVSALLIVLVLSVLVCVCVLVAVMVF